MEWTIRSIKTQKRLLCNCITAFYCSLVTNDGLEAKKLCELRFVKTLNHIFVNVNHRHAHEAL